jgi:hypothetical protein
VGVGITTGFFFGGVDWHHRHVRVVHVNNYYVRPHVMRRDAIAHRPIAPGRWEHNTSHRRGIAYRSPDVQKRYPAPAPRREFRTEPRPATGGPSGRRIERSDLRPQAQPQPGRAPRQQLRREERRDDRRGQAMPPAFNASSPRFEARQERAPQPRIEAPQRPQPRMDAPQRAQPRIEARQERAPQSRIEAPQRPQPRMENRGGGGNRGWRDQGGRGNGRS